MMISFWKNTYKYTTGGFMFRYYIAIQGWLSLKYDMAYSETTHLRNGSDN